MNAKPETGKYIDDLPARETSISACVAVPPVFDFYFTRHRFSGLGAEVVKKLLIKSGCNVRLFNFPLLSKKGVKESLPDALDFLSPHIMENEIGRVSFFTRYQRFGPPVLKCAEKIVECRPDMVFISCFAFCYASSALELAGRVRALDPRISIVMGGAGVSAYPHYFIKNPEVDFAITGEAEMSILLFMDMIQSGQREFSDIPNLYFKANGRVIEPARKKQTTAEEISFVLQKTGESKASVFYTTALSRGCPKTCRFCSNFLCHGREFRVVPVHRIRQEVDGMDLEQTGRDMRVHVNFEDDNLLLDPEYFLAVLDLFKSRFSDVRFSAENGVDYTMLTPDLTDTLIRYGMKQFNLSVASVHMDILKSESRPSLFSRYETIAGILDRHQVPCITYYICGFKQDTKKTVVSTIARLAENPTRLGISLFYPVPGIPDFQAYDLFDNMPPELCAGSSAYPWNGSMSTAEMVTAFRLSRFVNLLKSESVSEMEAALIEKSVQDRRLYTFVKEGRRENLIPVPGADNEMVRLFFDAVKDLPLNSCTG